MFGSTDFREKLAYVLALAVPLVAMRLHQEHLSLSFLIDQRHKVIAFTSFGVKLKQDQESTFFIRCLAHGNVLGIISNDFAS